MPIESAVFQIIAGSMLAVLCAYAAGRIHQWYEHSMDRDRSFREGYDNGYHALFPLAARGGWPAAELTGRDDQAPDANR